MSYPLPHSFGYAGYSRGYDRGALALAAMNGHVEMTQILLHVGASTSQIISGFRVISSSTFVLATAIHNRQEEVAITLSRTLDSIDVSPGCEGSCSTLLQMACEAKLVRVVHAFLELPSRNPWEIDPDVLNDRSIALCRVLQEDTWHTDYAFIENGLYNDTYEIVTMLLEHGANPDILCEARLRGNHRGIWGDYSRNTPLNIPKSRVSARSIAPVHPDPRVREVITRAPVHPKLSPEIWTWVDVDPVYSEWDDSPRPNEERQQVLGLNQAEGTKKTEPKTALTPPDSSGLVVGGLTNRDQVSGYSNATSRSASTQTIHSQSKAQESAQFWARRPF
jgi:hypothetical protein